MNRRRLLVLLVILGLLAATVCHVPVVKATTWYNFTTAPDYMQINIIGGETRVWLWCEGFPVNNVYNVGAVQNESYSFFCSVSLSAPTGGFLWLATGNYDFCSVLGVTNQTITDGAYHEVSIACSGDYAGVGKGWTWNWSGFINLPTGGTGGAVVAAQTQEAPVPLAVTIDSGPTAVDLVDGGSWHATATDGSGTGYTYAWDYGPIGPFFTYPIAGQTFTHIFTAGNWTISVRVTDSLGATAYDDIVVTAATIAGAYQAHLTRSGPLGQYMSITVTDAAGAPVTISSTSGTQYGLYEAGGAFGWFAADTEAVQYITYTWRWTMSYTITPPGLAIKPPPDFWFQSSVHLAIPNLNLLVMHHFTGISDIVDPWFPPGEPGTDVGPVIPETPPSPTSTLPDWLAPLWDFFVRLFKALFQPDATEFGKQLSGSWVTIASPVPSITPQYTIPFPNPSHLLAPTGDSVNIDFSGIMSYTGYSTYKLIVQVVLDAILLFVVISIIT